MGKIRGHMGPDEGHIDEIRGRMGENEGHMGEIRGHMGSGQVAGVAGRVAAVR